MQPAQAHHESAGQGQFGRDDMSNATKLTHGAFYAMLAWTSSATANVGPPNTGGKLAGEPAGIEDIVIERETLTLDLRALADGGAVLVEAIYRLNNNGVERRLELLFAAGSDVSEFRVTLDEALLATKLVPKADVPASWTAPNKTPPIPGQTSHGELHYKPRNPTLVGFSVTIPTGRHTLKAEYSGEAGVHQYGEPTVFRQFAYVLAPARSWAGFGGLDVTVHVPSGWHAAVTPELSREGDTLTGHFDSVPADSLALTVQAPESSTYQSVKWGTLALLLIALIGGIISCVMFGRRLGKHNATAWHWSIAAGLHWAGFVLGTGLLAIFAPDWTLSGQASHYGYGQAFAVIGVVLLAIVATPLGFGVTLVTAAMSRRTGVKSGSN
jgi:hypothetical protein